MRKPAMFGEFMSTGNSKLFAFSIQSGHSDAAEERLWEYRTLPQVKRNQKYYGWGRGPGAMRGRFGAVSPRWDSHVWRLFRQHRRMPRSELMAVATRCRCGSRTTPWAMFLKPSAKMSVCTIVPPRR